MAWDSEGSTTQELKRESKELNEILGKGKQEAEATFCGAPLCIEGETLTNRPGKLVSLRSTLGLQAYVFISLSIRNTTI